MGEGVPFFREMVSFLAGGLFDPRLLRCAGGSGSDPPGIGAPDCLLVQKNTQFGPAAGRGVAVTERCAATWRACRTRHLPLGQRGLLSAGTLLLLGARRLLLLAGVLTKQISQHSRQNGERVGGTA